MIIRDLRYACRVYRRTPFFSGVATLALAIAVAVATAVFNLYSHLALQPVAGVQGSGRLVSVGLAQDANEWVPFSVEQFRLLADALTVADAVVGVASLPREVLIDDRSDEAMVAGVTPGFMRELGVQVVLGADLDAASADPAAKNAVISESFWHEHFGARASVIGSVFQIGDEAFTVVGVAGGGFRGLHRGALRDDLWVPVEAALDLGAFRIAGGPAQQRQIMQRAPFLRVTARLAAGTGIERLQQELDLVWPRLRDATDTPVSSALMHLQALPGTAADPRRHQVLVRQSQLLAGGSGLVLLVASLNLASFMLARGPARIPELRTRLAIGASRPAVARQLFVEAALLITVATALGLLLHYWLRSLLLRLPPFVDVPSGWLQPQTDWRVFVFVIVAALAVTLIAGLLPAVRIARQPALSLTAPKALGARGRSLQPMLAGQVAVATLVLLAGTLFLGEVQRLERQPVGFEPAGVVAGQLFVVEQAPGAGGIRVQIGGGQVEQVLREIVDRVSALPGVQTIAFASAVPFHAPVSNPGLVELAGAFEQPSEDRRRVYYNHATPELFRTLNVGFLHGRPYDGTDALEVVVNATLARQLWGRENVVGERVTLTDGALIAGQGGIVVRAPAGDAPPEVYSVVGVVDDVRYAGSEDELPPMLYRPWSGSLFGLRYIVRGSTDEALLQAVVDDLVRERFPQMRAGQPGTLLAAMRDGLRDERARSRLALGAAALALLLTVVGLYASMQHMVDARRAELAVRKAIGAHDIDLVLMILRRAGAILVSGCVVALLAAVLLAERMTGLLFGLDTLSPSAWAVTLVVIAATGLAAAWLPALRAGRADPAMALRHD